MDGGVARRDAYLSYPDQWSTFLLPEMTQKDFQIPSDLFGLAVENNIACENLVATGLVDGCVTVVVILK